MLPADLGGRTNKIILEYYTYRTCYNYTIPTIAGASETCCSGRGSKWRACTSPAVSLGGLRSPWVEIGKYFCKTTKGVSYDA